MYVVDPDKKLFVASIETLFCDNAFEGCDGAWDAETLLAQLKSQNWNIVLTYDSQEKLADARALKEQMGADDIERSPLHCGMAWNYREIVLSNGVMPQNAIYLEKDETAINLIHENGIAVCENIAALLRTNSVSKDVGASARPQILAA
jgi:hypothetical protein